MNRTATASVRRKLAVGALTIGAFAMPALGAFAATAKPNDKLTAQQVAKARQLFAANSCGGCHMLRDAGGSGGIGPSLDGNPRLTHALVVDRVTNGSGSMPSFRGVISNTDIELLASYVVQAAASSAAPSDTHQVVTNNNNKGTNIRGQTVVRTKARTRSRRRR